MTDGRTFVVRDARRADAPALARIFREPDVVANTFRSPDTTPADVVRFLSVRHGARTKRLVAVDGDDAAGFLSLVQFGMPPAQHVGEFFVVVAGAWRRRGVARALVLEAGRIAFTEWDLARLELEVLVDNAGAIRLYESLGFQREGVKRRAFRRASGEVVDSMMMSVLREEWSP